MKIGERLRLFREKCGVHAAADRECPVYRPLHPTPTTKPAKPTPTSPRCCTWRISSMWTCACCWNPSPHRQKNPAYTGLKINQTDIFELSKGGTADRLLLPQNRHPRKGKASGVCRFPRRGASPKGQGPGTQKEIPAANIKSRRTGIPVTRLFVRSVRTGRPGPAILLYALRNTVFWRRTFFLRRV